MTARTLVQGLRRAAEREADKPAVVTPVRTLTYSELDLAADRVAGGLRELGIARGDRVAIVLPNVAEMPEAVYGVLRCGAAFTPINPTIKEDKLTRLLEHVGAAAVVCDPERSPMVRAAAERAGGVPVIADVAALQSGGAALSPAPLDADLAAVIYTSGSTGDPKGVTVTHGNMSFVAGSIIEYLEMSPADRVLSVLPLSFGYGLYQLLTCVGARATLVLEPGLGLPGRVVQALEQEQITGLPGVPTVFGVLLSLRGLADRELPHLRFLTNAGAAMPAATIEAVRRTFPGARLYSMYGQTECTRVCYLPPDQLDVRPTSVGIPIPGT
ncbi:MAG: class I adenylate-forming enzyme family protein [Thermoleophilaceae bacterium]